MKIDKGRIAWFRPKDNGGGVAFEINNGSKILDGTVVYSCDLDYAVGDKIKIPYDEVRKTEHLAVFKFNRRVVEESKKDKFLDSIEGFKKLNNPVNIEFPKTITDQIEVVAYRSHRYGVSIIGHKNGKYGLFLLQDNKISSFSKSTLFKALFANENLLRVSYKFLTYTNPNLEVPVEKFVLGNNMLIDPRDYDKKMSNEKS